MPRFSGSRRSRKRQLQASHQKNWLIGRHAVMETLAAGLWPVEELFLSVDLSEEVSVQATTLAGAAMLTAETVSSQRLTELCHSGHHQGMAARMGSYPYIDEQALLAACSLKQAIPTDERSRTVEQSPLIVVCDRIQDTFNFGAILRCCDAMNVTGVLTGSTEQAGVTPQVARSSAGAVNHIPVAKTDNIPDAVRILQKAGFTIASASEKSAAVAWDADLKRPMALIVGSEATGISDELLQLSDLNLRIPMMGQVDSLNAAVATGILLYEVRRQQVGK